MDLTAALAMLHALFLNFCVVTTAALMMGLTFQFSAGRLVTALRAGIYSVTGLALFALTFQVTPSMFIDLRVVPLALAAYRLGPGWALLAALPVTLYRISMGGPALGGSLTHMALVLLAATLLRHLVALPTASTRETARRAMVIFAVPTLTIFPTMLKVGLPLTAGILPYGVIVSLCVAAFTLWYAIVQVMAQAFDRASRLDTLGHTDQLTGLPNRLAFHRDIGAAPPDAPGQYLLLLNLDHLRAVNDRVGHDVGDQLLRAHGQELAALVASDGHAYRLGGEEFAVRFTASGMQAARQFADDLRRHLPVRVAASPELAPLHVTVSGGLVPDGAGALKAAERMLYAAKAAGRNRIVDSWDPSGTGARHTPLNDTSPAFGTIRTLLHFIAGNDHQDTTPILQGLLDAAIACIPGAEAGSITVRQGGDSVVMVQAGFSASLVGTRHTVAQMARWHGNLDAWRAGRARILSGDALRERSRSSHAVGSSTQAVLSTAGQQHALQANLLLPILVQGEVYAELNVDSLTCVDAFSEASMLIAEEFGLWAAAIFAARRRIRQAERSQDAALLTLGIALEARDMETQGHTRRVIELASALGAVLHLDPGGMQVLRQGAALHDLGKLMVPDHILLKPGALTADEWTVMKTHASLGADLAAQLTDLSPGVLDVIRSHHERWDGRGYPHGLSGADIPLAARIFSVCDVYDALTSDRPYKKAWTPQDALSEIAAQSGAQFDPLVVEAFLTLHGAGQLPAEPGSRPDDRMMLRP